MAQQKKPSQNWFSRINIFVKIIIFIIIIYILYSIISSIFAFVNPVLKGINSIFGPGGLNPSATKAPWWVWIGIAYYCGFFALAKAGMSKAAEQISFHSGDSIEKMAKEYDINIDTLKAEAAKSENKGKSLEYIANKLQKENMTDPYIEKLNAELEAAKKSGNEQLQNEIQAAKDNIEKAQEADDARADEAEKRHEGEVK